jgi:hypothetical protein
LHPKIVASVITRGDDKRLSGPDAYNDQDNAGNNDLRDRESSRTRIICIPFSHRTSQGTTTWFAIESVAAGFPESVGLVKVGIEDVPGKTLTVPVGVTNIISDVPLLCSVMRNCGTPPPVSPLLLKVIVIGNVPDE